MDKKKAYKDALKMNMFTNISLIFDLAKNYYSKHENIIVVLAQLKIKKVHRIKVYHHPTKLYRNILNVPTGKLLYGTMHASL